MGFTNAELQVSARKKRQPRDSEADKNPSPLKKKITRSSQSTLDTANGQGEETSPLKSPLRQPSPTYQTTIPLTPQVLVNLSPVRQGTGEKGSQIGSGEKESRPDPADKETHSDPGEKEKEVPSDNSAMQRDATDPVEFLLSGINHDYLEK